MLFQETQYLAWLPLLILGWVGLGVPALFVVLARWLREQGAQQGWPVRRILLTAAVLVFFLSAGIFLGTGKMTTVVDEHAVRVTFGWIPIHTRIVPAGDIVAVEAVQYDPGEFGGSGIRHRGNNALLSQLGNHAARLTLKSGSLLIGSQRSEELADAVRTLAR